MNKKMIITFKLSPSINWLIGFWMINKHRELLVYYILISMQEYLNKQNTI